MILRKQSHKALLIRRGLRIFKSLTRSGGAGVQNALQALLAALLGQASLLFRFSGCGVSHFGWLIHAGG